MEIYDPELAGRVWQRVRGGEPPEPSSQPSPQALALAELEQAMALLQLSRQLQGKEKSVVRRLYEEEMTHSHVLRGMHRMITGKNLPIRTAPPEPRSPETVLRKCYGNALRALREYEARSGDGEFGPVFWSLAQKEKTHCALLLELLGELRG